MASRTSNYYKKNPKARAKRLKQQAKYNKTSEGLKIRTAANKLNRKLGTYGNGDGKDASHTGPNKGKLESPKDLITMTSPEAKRLWRRAIKEHFNCTCAYCGEHYDINQLTLDHVRPKSLGGEDLTSNLVPACQKCNQDKGSSNWLQWMRKTFGVTPREQFILSHIN
jgi:5-methylcytosine-specific restriction endonuclease McrA